MTVKRAEHKFGNGFCHLYINLSGYFMKIKLLTIAALLAFSNGAYATTPNIIDVTLTQSGNFWSASYGDTVATKGDFID